MKKILIIFLILIINIMSCTCFARRMPKISDAKLKQMQEYIYDTDDTERVFKGVIGTLQDSDFVIQDIEPTLGFIRGNKIFKGGYVNKKRVAGWSAVLALATAYTVFSYGATAASMYSPSRRIATEMKDKTIVVDTNVYIEPTQDNKTKVRFILVAKVLQNADGFAFCQNGTVRVLRLYKKEVYEEFFAQLKDNIFD